MSRLLATTLVVLASFTPLGCAATADEKKFENFDQRSFGDDSINIDNEWWPLQPGMQFIYEGATVEAGKSTAHRVIFTVTDLVKVIDGVRTVVVFDRDYTDDMLLESELAFFAQDNDGNVWHLGQYRETYDDVELIGGRAWLVGHLEGAKAGIMMKAKPQPGAPSYSQGFAPAPFNWTDRARTVEMGQRTTVAAGSYENVLVSEEFNEEEPNAFQIKFYAPGTGVVRVGWRGDDSETETLELVEVVKLEGQALADIRAEALELEKRNYVYGRTPAAEQR
jgi:hypothetical protein